ncbi:unnamed protein product [Leptidea sinapis]|uniref:GOLD domain-containing protein n=2 Tax=Leptidea sinapis TaxID=189913 RepID=A0A5E4QCV6_9NEOP|nr:unnamed protein product [Leptidea sinapis]
MKVNTEKIPLETDQGIIESEERRWGLPLKEVYKHGLLFYKAYTQQTAHGPLDVNSVPPLGVLDVIGRDRRAAWQALGHMSQIQAMAGFIHTLDRLCPSFRPYIEAIQKDFEDKKEQEVKKEQQLKNHKELEDRVLLERDSHNNAKLTEEEQVQRVKDALNAQSYEQFYEYAQQQFPDNVDHQAVLIRQLQDKHYQEYIQQLAVDERLAKSHINFNEEDTFETNDAKKDCNSNDTDIIDSNEYKEDSRDGLPGIDEARMWCRGSVEVFKQSARDNGGTLTVAHGETVTVRVPTHSTANAICWEFATDYYDIGFGLYFEWSKSPTTEVTIHVSEDPEMGRGKHLVVHTRPMVSLVVPIYRRDCHTEVYAGSHTYPGEGVYLLKFDNTYSLWRSKTLYYKVYYTQ